MALKIIAHSTTREYSTEPPNRHLQSLRVSVVLVGGCSDLSWERLEYYSPTSRGPQKRPDFCGSSFRRAGLGPGIVGNQPPRQISAVNLQRSFERPKLPKTATTGTAIVVVACSRRPRWSETCLRLTRLVSNRHNTASSEASCTPPMGSSSRVSCEEGNTLENITGKS